MFQPTSYADPEIIQLVHDSDWVDLAARFDAGRDNPALERVFQVARENGAVRVLVEQGYVCRDFRSEHAGFYGTMFREIPSRSTRLNFFDCLISRADVEAGKLPQEGYLGYSVVRPLAGTPVGRTVIRPPKVPLGRFCQVDDVVDVLGSKLVATGVPFMSQDGSYLRCAHVAQWMVLYHAHLRGVVPRLTPADIQQAGLGGEVVGRQVPSSGLSPAQMLHSLYELGLSPGSEPLPKSREESRAADGQSLPAVLCRYVNSQMPPIVMSATHVWVVVGYSTDAEFRGHDSIRFFRHDDVMGPYLPVSDPWNEISPEYRQWIAAYPPLPRKCYLVADRAELLGEFAFKEAGIDCGRRTYAIKSSDFKHGLEARGVPPEVAASYRLESWPRWIWVVEALDREKRAKGVPDVVGEAIFDATMAEVPSGPNGALREDGPLLAIHAAGVLMLARPGDWLVLEGSSAATREPYDSGMPAPPANG